MTTTEAARAGRLPLGNEEVAKRLEQAARTLEEQDANVYRVRAYRTAANTVRGLDRPVSEVLKAGARRWRSYRASATGSRPRWSSSPSPGTFSTSKGWASGRRT